MTKEEIALELALASLRNFEYDFSEFGGNSIQEHIEIATKTACEIYNNIYKNLELKD